MDAFITKHGPFDLIIFDNIQALLIGEMKEEEPWSKVQPWVRDLTRRSIGQLWLHHTGIDESRGYGTKTKEWQMDTVGLMERIADTTDDIAFTLKFTKARERSPENRADFAPVTIFLRGDEWLIGEVPPATKKDRKKANPVDAIAERALKKAIDEAGTVAPASNHIPDHTKSVTVDLWKAYALKMDISDAAETRSCNQTFTRAAKRLHQANIIGCWDGQCWIIKS